MKHTGAILKNAFDRHERVAFQFSGGRDSVAALYLLRPWWRNMVVYHLDTGDQFPEIKAVVDQVRKDVDMVIIPGRVQEVRATHGMPTDILPVDNTDLGRMVSGETQKLIGRYQCCALSLMIPMHERMRDDGITLIVRGQRADEFKGGPPVVSGDRDGGFEVMFPIEDWTAMDVDNFVHTHQLPVAPFYREGMTQAPECMGCTAWWGEGRLRYLEKHHPVRFAQVGKDMAIIAAAIERQADQLEN